MTDIDPQFAACLQKATEIVSAYRAEAPIGCDPQNVVEIGPEWDPAAHDYNDFSTPDGRLMGQIMGLTALSAFALIGIGAFCTVAAAEVGTALDITYTVGGSTIIAGGTAMTEGQAAILAVSEAEGMTGFGAALLETIIEGGFTALFSVESLLALSNYQIPYNPQAPNFYGGLGNYLGWFVPGGGGITEPPGFPGFPGHGYPVGGGWVCWVHNDVEYCHWEY